MFRQRLEPSTRGRRRVIHRSESHERPQSPHRLAPSPHVYELRLPPSRSGKTASGTLYSFAVDGKKLPLFAAVSRVKRDAEHQFAGYQRAESIQHIRTIRRYLETADAVLPNALVVAFDSRVRFEAIDGSPDDATQMGHLIVPVDESETDDEKPAWIVDGQQRTAAIREADVDAFPVYVTAFITDCVMRAALPVHPRELDQAAAEGTDPRTAAGHAGGRPAAARCSSAATRRNCSTDSTTTRTRRCAAGSGRPRPPRA